MNRLPSIVRQHVAALRGLLLFTVICGIIYPVVMFGVAQVAFHKQANGSQVSYNGHVVGSSLLCQE
ncbi:MAG TPA: potassium-transporting ATPase subunit C, partial [Streptosporangiaceae bacterium]